MKAFGDWGGDKHLACKVQYCGGRNPEAAGTKIRNQLLTAT